jgi:hypothetical protein
MVVAAECRRHHLSSEHSQLASHVAECDIDQIGVRATALKHGFKTGQRAHETMHERSDFLRTAETMTGRGSSRFVGKVHGSFAHALGHL